jgi:hypothetical protein
MTCTNFIPAQNDADIHVVRFRFLPALVFRGIHHSMWQILVDVWKWLSTHEWFAIWLEGIALVAIFVLDYRNSKHSHKETLAQLEIAKEQAEAAKLAAESIKNSERAWLSASLLWSESARILYTEDGTGKNQHTQAHFSFRLKNDGKTPAWVESVVSGMDIPGHETNEPSKLLTVYLEPLGAGAEQRVALTLMCSGKPKMLNSEMLRVRITVNYRDIFERKTMPLEFSINPLTYQIQRLEKIVIPNIAIP